MDGARGRGVASRPGPALRTGHLDIGRRRQDPKTRSARLRFSASLDGGDTWLPSVPVSTKLFAVDGPRGLSVHATASGGGRRVRDGAPPTPATDMIQTPLNAGARQMVGAM